MSKFLKKMTAAFTSSMVMFYGVPNIAELVQWYADEYANRHANKVTPEEENGAEFAFDDPNGQ